jgi:hypothetical protein
VWEMQVTSAMRASISDVKITRYLGVALTWLRNAGSLAAAVFVAIFLNTSLCHAEDTAPLVLPLIKLEYPGEPKNIRMVYLRLIKLGDHTVDQPLVLDTGSPGITVDCALVLPAKMCSSEGVKIDKETVVDGITVTTQQHVAHYGTYDEYGNLAYAVVQMGSDNAPVVTQEPIAFLIRTKKVRRSDGQIVGGPLWPKGMIGISPIGAIDEAGSIRSPLAAVAAPAGLHRGYTIGALGKKWKICTIEDGNCPEVPALSIGIDPDKGDGWKFIPIARANTRFNFPTMTACFSFGQKTSCKPTLFDTGNSTMVVAGSAGKPLKKGVPVKVMSVQQWEFVTRYSPEVEFAEGLDHHIVGIRFFEENRLAVDLDEGRIGIAIGAE